MIFIAYCLEEISL